MKLLQIEFALCPSGDLLIQDAKGVRTYREEDRDITDTLFAMIETVIRRHLRHFRIFMQRAVTTYCITNTKWCTVFCVAISEGLTIRWI